MGCGSSLPAHAPGEYDALFPSPRHRAGGAAPAHARDSYTKVLARELSFPQALATLDQAYVALSDERHSLRDGALLACLEARHHAETEAQ